MNVMVIGSGGREYAIGLAMKRDSEVDRLYFVPGNGATSHLGENIAIEDYEELAEFAKEQSIDLTVVGPEAPLTEGVVDIFKLHGLTIFGPSRAAARLEGSKVYMKDFLAKYGIPTAKYIQTDSAERAYQFIDTLELPVVVKTDGLAAGKGVIIAQSYKEAKETAGQMLSGNLFGDAGKKIIIEEFLDGYELSVFAICDGENYKILPAAQDHKRLKNADEGPNTGGMGAYAPTPLINSELYEKIQERIIEPTLDGMKAEGAPYEGVLFIGLMVVDDEPITLEFNVRFGDPECEILMPLMKTPVSELFYKGATRQLSSLNIEFFDKYAVGVVMASRDYPYKSTPPAEIFVDEGLIDEAHIAYAGVSEEGGKLYASGGRVLVCVGVSDTIAKARDSAYALCKRVNFAGKQYREDIAYQALKS